MLRSRRNILVSGGTGSGKTTLLNALIELLPEEERIVAIEDTLELRIDRTNCLRFEAGTVGSEAPVSIRDLVKHSLRHRPDHIVVGEVRGGEAADLLQALNTGHGGSLTTVHANNASSALSRLASCAMQAGGALPWEVTCRGVVDGIHLVVHMTRRGGRRFVEEALRVKGYDAAANRWLTEPVWRKHDEEPTRQGVNPCQATRRSSASRRSTTSTGSSRGTGARPSRCRHRWPRVRPLPRGRGQRRRDPDAGQDPHGPEEEEVDR